MEQHIIKAQLSEALAGKKVTAAVFYTFGFSPFFFENYLLDVFFPQYKLTNNPIENALIWKKITREKALPDLTIYYDDKVKSKNSSPYLDYVLRAVRIKKVFHPKMSLILTEDLKSGTPRLLVLTGSNNLTTNGWCKNVEGISILELENGKFYPKILKDRIRAFIMDCKNTFFEYADLSNAELNILSFLNKRKYTHKYEQLFLHTSFGESFEAFLDRHIFNHDTIEEAEIISPFWTKDIESSPIRHILDRIEKVRCLIPYKHSSEIQLEKTTFSAYKNAGVIWSDYLTKSDTSFLPNTYNHSKVYRFKGQKRSYVIIGSVNCTKEAWGYFTNNLGNIETALLFKETVNKYSPFLNSIGDNLSDLSFIGQIKEEENDLNFYENITPPIDFTINWRDKTILYSNHSNKQLLLELPTDLQVVIQPNAQKKEISLFNKKRILEVLASDSLLKVSEKINPSSKKIYYYYPIQLFHEVKPFPYPVSEFDIFKFWANKEGQNAPDIRLIEKFANRIKKKETDSEPILTEGVLNKMAAHFHGLTQLEKRIFEAGNQMNDNIKYYLLTKNIDTLPIYLEVLENLAFPTIAENAPPPKPFNKGAIWVMAQIVLQRFYEHKDTKSLKKIDPNFADLWKLQRKEVQNLCQKIKEKASLEPKYFEWAKQFI